MDLVPLFTTILTTLQGIGAVLGGIWLSWNGYTYMSSTGSPHKQEMAKSGAIDVLKGLILVEAALGISNFLVQNIPH
jgi:hypothetical protein